MKLFSFTHEGIQFELVGSNWSGLEQLLINGKEVSRKRNFRYSGSHEFDIPQIGTLTLNFKIDYKSYTVSYQLYKGSELLVEGSAETPMPGWVEKMVGIGTDKNGTLSKSSEPDNPKKGHFISFIGLFLKLFKSAKVVKVVLAGAALSGWTILYSWEFALVIIAVIVFHEYGHLQAMKKCGIPTKGMYLIPFVGGVAVGDRAKTQWHDVYISMMGPIYGLLMTVAFYILYLVTDNHFVGLIASVSALVNIFNLLPIYPLDGGRVVKSLVFSSKKYWGFLALLVVSTVCFFLTVYYGLVFLSFFIVLGVIDLIASWRMFSHEEKGPMKIYGILFSLAWYLVSIIVFLGVIYLIAASGLPGSELATSVLES